uniref:Putative secreted protein n=1 Tax=Anopheles darlingi TaxID=43151 RepID=A0A2M4D231_ANODA
MRVDDSVPQVLLLLLLLHTVHRSTPLYKSSNWYPSDLVLVVPAHSRSSAAKFGLVLNRRLRWTRSVCRWLVAVPSGGIRCVCYSCCRCCW